MIVFDLDGTLADCEHRRHFVDPSKRAPNGCFMNEDVGDGFYFKRDLETFERTKEPWKPDYKSFYEECDQDSVIKPVKSILIQYCHREIEIWSGRCESVRKKTEVWLDKNIFDGDFQRFKNIKLKMRPIGDYTPDNQLKEKWLDDHIAGGGTPIEMVFEDRRRVLDMWIRRGIFVFDVSQGKGDF